MGSPLFVPIGKLGGTTKVGAPELPTPKEKQMTQKPETKSKALNLEVDAVESYCNPGCGSSSTDPRCTCPIRLTTTASLFTARTVS
jgi:hypothetical protein